MKLVVAKLEYAFRHLLVYPLFRILFRNERREERIDLMSVRKILFLRYDRIGDMIVTTPIFRNLKRLHPTLHIGVVTSRLNAELISNNPHVDATYVVSSQPLALIREVFRARRERYDVVINFIFNRTTTGGLLANLIAPKGFKVGQGDDKYRFYFNRLLVLERGASHMVDTLASIIQQVFGIGLKPEDLELEIYVDEASKRRVHEYLRRNGLRRWNHGGEGSTYIIYNLSATDAVRRLSPQQAALFGRWLGTRKEMRTVLLVAPGDREMERVATELVRNWRCLRFPPESHATLLEIASIIEGALCCVTPDTSIIHFASAMKTPVLGLFTPLQGMHEWLPYRIQHKLVTAESGQPVASITSERMISEMKDFFEVVERGSTR
jgi:ADP-heptose:LPS heptosyltransferase